jgi:hypothetical protein
MKSKKKLNDALYLLDPNYVSIVHIEKKKEMNGQLCSLELICILKMREREKK